jgi:hypothetical protein
VTGSALARLESLKAQIHSLDSARRALNAARTQ